MQRSIGHKWNVINCPNPSKSCRGYPCCPEIQIQVSEREKQKEKTSQKQSQNLSCSKPQPSNIAALQPGQGLALNGS